MASVMYLLQERELKLKTFGAIFHRLPPLTTVTELGNTAGAVGLILFTLGIVTGMVWSFNRTGSIWHNDPKEIFALLTWLLYLALDSLPLTRLTGADAAQHGWASLALHLFSVRYSEPDCSVAITSLV